MEEQFENQEHQSDTEIRSMKKLIAVGLLVVILIILGYAYFTSQSGDDTNKTDEAQEQEQKDSQNQEVVEEETKPVDGKDQTREKHITRILEGIVSYLDDGNSKQNLGSLPTCKDGRLSIGTDGLDLNSMLVDTYLKKIPVDPAVGTANVTGYEICENNNGQINISAPNADQKQLQVLN